MTTVSLWLYIIHVWNMFRQLSSSHYNRAWLLITKICNMLCQLSSSHDTAQSMVIRPQVWNMLCQLAWSDNNGQGMAMYFLVMKNAPSVVIVSLQRSENGNVFLSYEACSISLHRLVTTDRAWLFIPKICNMLCQLSSSNDNGQMKHARSAVIVSWQRSEHGSVFVRYDTFSVSCHCLMPMVGARLFIP